MNEQVSVTKSPFHDWVDNETRHIDVVASWENLNDAYDTLRFKDELTDTQRIEEYKWIVQQMNAFLTRTRKKLMTCKNEDAAIEMLGKSFTPSGEMELNARRALAYQKLKQQWIMASIMKLNMMKEQMNKEEYYAE